ncbi:MAG: permease, partial [Candidatus Thermoplasmatota archaeon]|nr:permease [Candidatus Thermoplasmatota archaeon]
MDNIVYESLLRGLFMVWEYLKLHTLTCLIPAFFIAGAIAVMISKESVLKYLGAGANKIISYTVAAVSGTILAVCSCTVLPLFAGIYKRGAGIGPAVAFLFSGPAINVLAIVFTARILGFEIGFARAVAAISMSVVIGLIMAAIFRKEDIRRKEMKIIEIEKSQRPIYITPIFFILLVVILLVGANGAIPIVPKLVALYFLTVAVLILLMFFYTKDETKQFGRESFDLAKKVFPLLLVGVFVSGILFGETGKSTGIIPPEWIAWAVGGNSLLANFFSSIVGAFMYFATLTEVPILQGLMNSGMGQGPALAMLLSGPSLSLPSMIVLGKLFGAKKT